MRLPLIAVVAAVLPGCQMHKDALTTSAAHLEVSAAASSVIAGDMVSRFAEHVGQGKSTIVLKADASAFGKALVVALKGWGYAVATDQKIQKEDQTIQLAYMVDDFEGQTFVRLSTEKIELARTYSTTTTGASPSAPLSVMRRN